MKKYSSPKSKKSYFLDLISSQILTRIFYTFVTLFCFHIQSFAQPTSNPYSSRYSLSSNWTDSLKWSTIVNATTAPSPVTTSASATNNTTNLRLLINSISLSGGGVIYFPAGTYNFNDSILLKTGVILRGETPSIANATSSNYDPGTNFVFPQYLPTFTGSGTANSTAFKFIGAEANAINIGLVDLDINRAEIAIYPHNWINGKGVDINKNILIFGCRSNNVSKPEPFNSNTNSWKRNVWRFSSNFNLYVLQNGVIVNCKINDAPTDSYNQPEYASCSGAAADGSDYKFNVTNHYGIVLNRSKISGSVGTSQNPTFKVIGFKTYAQPEDEPQLYAKGNIIRDNWVFKTMRIGIMGAGNGLLIKGNEIYDTPNKNMYLNMGGTGCAVAGYNNLENKGIDFSGWNVNVENNKIQTFKHTISNTNISSDNDGHGILIQECCGGTSNIGNTITNNNSNADISLFKIRDFNNVSVKGNNLNGASLILIANTTPASSGCSAGGSNYYLLNNVTVENNINVDTIIVEGTKGGRRNVIRNNTPSGSNPTIITSCNVDVQANNINFNPTIYKAIEPNSNCGIPQIASNFCFDNFKPLVRIVNPREDTSININSNSVYKIKVKTKGLPKQNSVSIFVNTDKIVSNLMPNVDSTVVYNWTIPQTGVYEIVSRTYDTSSNIYTLSGITKITANTTLGLFDENKTSFIDNNISIYPNPSNGAKEVTMDFNDNIDLKSIDLYSTNGVFISNTKSTDSKVLINVSSLSRGLYIVKITSNIFSKIAKISILN